MSDTVKALTGLGMAISGIALGLYVGVWVCFIGGIVDVIQQIRAEYLEVMVVAWGISKIVLSGFFGLLSGIALIYPGVLLIKSA